jgi:predicted enzyme related to lactoylglutathione lyase
MADSKATTPATSTSPPFKYQKPASNCACFVTIPVTEVPRAQKFYSSVFEWNFWTAPGSSVTIFHTGGDLMGRLSHREESQINSGSGITLYILVEDIDVTLKKVVEAGGSVEKSKFEEGGHTEMALFRDTEGNLSGVLRWLI